MGVAVAGDFRRVRRPGNLHIGDLAGGELSVIVVDTVGQLAVKYGRQGEGPGEFRYARDAAAVPCAER